MHQVENNSVRIGDPSVFPSPKFSQHQRRITLSFYPISSVVQRDHWAIQMIVFHCHKLQLQQYSRRIKICFKLHVHLTYDLGHFTHVKIFKKLKKKILLTDSIDQRN